MKTVQEVFNTLDDDQKNLLYFMIEEVSREKDIQIFVLKNTNLALTDALNEYKKKESIEKDVINDVLDIMEKKLDEYLDEYGAKKEE